MALKNNWVDKVDGKDYIKAEDINSVAAAVIDIEEQASLSDIYLETGMMKSVDVSSINGFNVNLQMTRYNVNNGILSTNTCTIPLPLSASEDIDVYRNEVTETINMSFTNAVKGKLDKLDEIDEANKSVKNIVANALRGSAEGGWIVLDDVSPVEHTATVHSVFDNSNGQVVVCHGKNIIEKTYFDGNEKTFRGITYTVGEDGEINISGTATGSSYFFLFKNQPLPVGKYTLSGSVEGVLINIQKNGAVLGASSKGNAYQFNVSSGDMITSAVYVDTDVTVEATIYPQIELGNKATTYESPCIKKDIYDIINGRADITLGQSSYVSIGTSVEDVLHCEYNRDINKAFETLTNAIISLGGNV